MKRRTTAAAALLLAALLLTTCGVRDLEEWPVSYELELGHSRVSHVDAALLGGKPALCQINHEQPLQQSQGGRTSQKQHKHSLHYWSARTAAPGQDDWSSVQIPAKGVMTECRLTEMSGRPVVVFSGQQTAVRAAVPEQTPATPQTGWNLITLESFSASGASASKQIDNLMVSGRFVSYSISTKQAGLKEIRTHRLELRDGELTSTEQPTLSDGFKPDSTIQRTGSDRPVDPILFVPDYSAPATRKHQLAVPELKDGELRGWTLSKLDLQGDYSVSDLHWVEGRALVLATVESGSNYESYSRWLTREGDGWKELPVTEDEDTPISSWQTFAMHGGDYAMVVYQLGGSGGLGFTSDIKFTLLQRGDSGWEVADRGTVAYNRSLHYNQKLLLSEKGRAMLVTGPHSGGQNEMEHLKVYLQSEQGKTGE